MEVLGWPPLLKLFEARAHLAHQERQGAQNGLEVIAAANGGDAGPLARLIVRIEHQHGITGKRAVDQDGGGQRRFAGLGAPCNQQVRGAVDPAAPRVRADELRHRLCAGALGRRRRKQPAEQLGRRPGVHLLMEVRERGADAGADALGRIEVVERAAGELGGQVRHIEHMDREVIRQAHDLALPGLGLLLRANRQQNARAANQHNHGAGQRQQAEEGGMGGNQGRDGLAECPPDCADDHQPRTHRDANQDLFRSHQNALSYGRAVLSSCTTRVARSNAGEWGAGMDSASSRPASLVAEIEQRAQHAAKRFLQRQLRLVIGRIERRQFVGVGGDAFRPGAEPFDTVGNARFQTARQ